MNYRTMFMGLLLLASASLQAQLELRPFFGGILSTIENSEEVEFENEWGVNFGLDLVIGNRLYMQPGLHYSGVQNEVSAGGGVDERAEIRVDNFTIPVLVGYRFFDEETDRLFNIRLFTGPSLSFVSSVDDGESQLDIDKEDFKNATFGWNAGIGVDFLIAFLDVGYRFGLTDVFDDFNIPGIEVENSRNNLLIINAGVRFRI